MIPTPHISVASKETKDAETYSIDLLQKVRPLSDFHAAAFLILKRWHPSEEPSSTDLEALIKTKQPLAGNKDVVGFMAEHLKPDQAVLIEDWGSDQLYLVEKLDDKNFVTAVRFGSKGCKRITNMPVSDTMDPKRFVISCLYKLAQSAPTPCP
ncbi:MAG: hypothetical protein PHS57_02195 [Alphaproteobacteria bacterium]|nr:hypothetical protein [Alphaproteobacteria bacterium]